MQKTYDIVIVGAGPAGSSAAIKASAEGAETILIEKRRKIGVPVKCGEFIPSPNEIERIMPEAKEHLDFYKILEDREIVTNRIKRIRVHSPKDKVYTFNFDGIVLRRDVFDRTLSLMAEEKGVTLERSSIATSIAEKGGRKKILLNTREGRFTVESKILIGADGFPSRISTLKNLNSGYKRRDIAICIQQRIERIQLDEEAVDIYINAEYAPGGYAWIIPKGDGSANVGLGARLSHLESGAYLKDYLKRFLKEIRFTCKVYPNIEEGGFIVKMLPVGGLMKRLYDDNVLLTGDASGTVNPINGSGIPTAIVSGCIAGEVASKNLMGECELSVYPEALKREVGHVLNRGLRYRRIADLFMYSNSLFERLLRIIGEENIGRIIKCEPLLA